MKIKSAADWINKHFLNPEIITKDIGNTGYFIKHGKNKQHYTYLSKKEIIHYMSNYEWYGYNSRQKKLNALKIMEE